MVFRALHYRSIGVISGTRYIVRPIPMSSIMSTILMSCMNRYIPHDPEHPCMGGILDNPQFRERRFVFSDRQDAGKKLGAYIRSHLEYPDPVVVAIPAGGVPVGKEVALALGAPLELCNRKKNTDPWQY